MSLVSMVVPTYYRNERLRAALESVAAQTHEPLEVVVVDDSGEGHARPVVEGFDGVGEAVEYVAHDANQGAQAARATGLDTADGDYVQLLDDDDRLAPDKVARQVGLLEARTDVGVAYCGFDTEDGKRFPADPPADGAFLERALRFDNAPCITSTMLVDAGVLEAVRPLARDSPGADDIRLCIELARRTGFAAVDDVLVTKGVPGDARGSSWGAVRGRWEILESYRDLYAARPDEVHRAALTNAYLWQGLRHVEASWWSPRAVYSFGQAVRTAPRLEPLHVGMFLASVFGGAGWRVGQAVADRVWDGGAHVS
jgi:glycosyltransferase involved in cell wall biosynthesis